MKHWPLRITMALGSLFALETFAQTTDAGIVKNPQLIAKDFELLQWSFKIPGAATSPFRYGDRLFYTTRLPSKKNALGVSRLFSVIKNSPAQPMPFNPKEDDVHIGAATLNTTANRIYYALFSETSSGFCTQSEICYRDKEYDGNWGSVVKLPKHINKPNTICLQPAWGYDSNLKKDVLFFVSNRAGGKGGFDIWYSTLERDGSFGDPVNLPCNTAADEMTPYFVTQRQILLFNSTMQGGKGGQDIYATEKNEGGEWLPAVNLSQVNTAFDEAYFSYHPHSNTCYFSSNRPNQNCQNQPSGCKEMSIFTGNLGNIFHVDIFNAQDSTPLYGCNVEMEDVAAGLVELSVEKSEESIVEFAISPEKKYRLIVSHEGFYPVFVEIDRVGTDFFKPIKKQVFLRPM